MTVFVIEGHGKRYSFATLNDARAAAQRIMDATGVIIGIVEQPAVHVHTGFECGAL